MKHVVEEDFNSVLQTKNHYIYKNQTWLCLIWYPKTAPYQVTDIRITGWWHEYGIKPSRPIIVNHKIKAQQSLIVKSTNSFNSFPQQEINTDAKNKIVKAIKDANAIVIKGALNEKNSGLYNNRYAG